MTDNTDPPRARVQIFDGDGAGSVGFTVHGADAETLHAEMLELQRYGKRRVVTVKGRVLPPPTDAEPARQSA